MPLTTTSATTVAKCSPQANITMRITARTVNMEIETQCPFCEVPYPLEKVKWWAYSNWEHEYFTEVICENCRKLFAIPLPREYECKLKVIEYSSNRYTF